MKPACRLPLVKLGAAVPPVVTVCRDQEFVLGLAEGLLELGVLREDDWDGNLEDSLRGGLERWVTAELGAADLKFVHPALMFTDDTENLGWAYYWGDVANGPGWVKEEEIGAFSFACDVYETVHVGRWVEALERVAKGAGFSVLGLVEAAVETTVGVAGPSWGDCWLDDNGFYEPDEDGVTITGEEELTTALLRKSIPKEAFSCRWDPAPVERARKRLLRKPGQYADAPQLAALVDAAVALATLMDCGEQGQPLNQGRRWFEQEAEVILPLLLRWSPEDELARLFDDYTELASNGGWTEQVFIRGFQLYRPAETRGSLAHCIAGLRLAVSIVVHADRLLRLLDGTDRLSDILRDAPEETRVRVTA